ncbi:alpha/beta hydrolase [Cryobacterium sp. SO2]|uniref:alpha/beta fold hydrolase n=1 Tax=Cryobacterium sp. SO2 TaxID=1897060 RepID=UPI00223D04DE|nr:alpha/beta hydrolase [Cryobacterium sp. SO2]WEO75805.1 alpha/beta hydrolase [Cryobacterium sp. SO2]
MHIVLVHGAGGTPSTWSAVTPVLEARGLPHTLVSNPLKSLRTDVANTLAVIDSVQGPVLLVGHSYGGAVITNAGRHDAVQGLVYIAAFAPDHNESVTDVVRRYEPAEVSKYMERGENGEWSTGRGGDFWAEIGWDVPAEHRESLISETRRSENAIFDEESHDPAWQVLPSWYLVASRDRTLRPDAQRDMAARAGAVTTSIDTSHFTPRVAPETVVDVIERAFRALASGNPAGKSAGHSAAEALVEHQADAVATHPAG